MTTAVLASLLGLTEAGQRNRTRQRKEKLLKAETSLEKHLLLLASLPVY